MVGCSCQVQTAGNIRSLHFDVGKIWTRATGALTEIVDAKKIRVALCVWKRINEMGVAQDASRYTDGDVKVACVPLLQGLWLWRGGKNSPHALRFAVSFTNL